MKFQFAMSAALGLALAGSSAFAAPIAVKATTNATVRVAGPRSGTSGTVFFNVEGGGQASAANSCYGTADFAGSAFQTAGTTVTGLNAISLSLIESNSAFTAPGGLEFYLADTSTVVTPGATAPNYVSGQDGTAAVGTALGTLSLLGTGTFSTTGNPTGSTGTVDTYTFTSSISSAATSTLISDINGGTAFRIVVVSAAGATPNTVAATFAGAANTTAGQTNSPLLTIDTTTTPSSTPEPASLGLLSVTAGLLGRRRRA